MKYVLSEEMKKISGIPITEDKLRFSVALLDKKAVDNGKAEIVAENIDIDEFSKLANKMKFTAKRKDDTLVGYYYVNHEGDALTTYSGHHKKGSFVEI